MTDEQWTAQDGLADPPEGATMVDDVEDAAPAEDEEPEEDD